MKRLSNDLIPHYVLRALLIAYFKFIKNFLLKSPDRFKNAFTLILILFFCIKLGARTHKFIDTPVLLWGWNGLFGMAIALFSHWVSENMVSGQGLLSQKFTRHQTVILKRLHFGAAALLTTTILAAFRFLFFRDRWSFSFAILCFVMTTLSQSALDRAELRREPRKYNVSWGWRKDLRSVNLARLRSTLAKQVVFYIRSGKRDMVSLAFILALSYGFRYALHLNEIEIDLSKLITWQLSIVGSLAIFNSAREDYPCPFICARQRWFLYWGQCAFWAFIVVLVAVGLIAAGYLVKPFDADGWKNIAMGLLIAFFSILYGNALKWRFYGQRIIFFIYFCGSLFLPILIPWFFITSLRKLYRET